MYNTYPTEQVLLRMKALQPRVPGWAKAERMETVVSQKELWHYADDPKGRAGFRVWKKPAKPKTK